VAYVSVCFRGYGSASARSMATLVVCNTTAAVSCWQDLGLSAGAEKLLHIAIYIGWLIAVSVTVPPRLCLRSAASGQPPMAPAYLSIWKRCLQELQRLPEVLDNPAAEFATAARISSEETKWLALPVLSASAWKALVLELKVRHRKPMMLDSLGWWQLDTGDMLSWL